MGETDIGEFRGRSPDPSIRPGLKIRKSKRCPAILPPFDPYRADRARVRRAVAEHAQIGRLLKTLQGILRFHLPALTTGQKTP